MPSAVPSVAQLQHALALAEQIQRLEEELSSILGSLPASSASPVASSSSPAPARSGRRGGKRVVSAETRAKMAAAAKARYARKNGGAAPSPARPAGRKKRVLSPEGRARIVAALKARHAAKKAAGK